MSLLQNTGLIGKILMVGGELDESIVDEWYWLDRQGDLMTGTDCKKEYEMYKETKQFYRSK